MANDKDFIVKNAIEVGKDTKVTLGTITSSNIDLSTGNYFNDTLTANTTYTISNAGAVQSFQIEVTGGAIGYNLADASYDSVSFSVASQESAVSGIFFKTDGTKMFICGSTGDDVNEYALSTAFDVSTASYTQNFSVSSQEASPDDLTFKPDGTKMYIVGTSGDDINEYDLSTAWDVSTASYVQNFSVSAKETSPRGIVFNNDGTKVFITGTGSKQVHEYGLTTAYDISTASFTASSSLSLNNVSGIQFNSDGTKMFISDYFSDDVRQYSLSTGFDISTASYDSVAFSVSSQDTVPTGLFFGNSGTKMYVLGNTNDTVFQYSTGTDATLTWPSSIEWAGSVAPAAPANGETDLFTISTDDGGTTYHGFKTADNLS